jgi:hypothetical protein
LPATNGSAPVAVFNAATRDPLPGSRPRSVDRVLDELPNRVQTDGGDFARQRFSADDQHSGADRKLLGEQPCGALGAGHHILSGGGETEFEQVCGDIGRRPGGVVGHVEGTPVKRLEGLDRAGGGHMPAEQRAIQVK